MSEIEAGASPGQNEGIGDLFPPLGFSPGLASSTFGREGGVRSLLYIQRNHLGFDLAEWIRVVAFILLFGVNKLEMSLISWTNCQ